MRIIKIEIKSIFGSVLFEHECEDNTLKNTLSEALKIGADLRCANLSSADLSGADLSSADLSGANLSDADLRCANLSSADLSGADLSSADLRRADLSSADLRCANLRCANLSSADLRCADLRRANLSGANLSGAKDVPYLPTNLPEGEFVAFKKLPNGLIAKLKILGDSKRSRATSDKCRCDKALVTDLQNADGTKSDMTEYISREYAECKYKIGEIVETDEWDEDRWAQCSHGIHFFLDRQSALNYER